MTTWTPATQQVETWTSEDPSKRVFSPYVFSRYPIFATGSAQGAWTREAAPSSTWTPE